MRRLGLIGSVLLAGMLLAACGGGQYATKGIEGLLPDLRFELTGESGEPLTAADLRGAPVVLFFGFTHCPDICPTAMARISAALRAVDDPAAEEVQILFVSVDPGRDDPETLRRYTNAFGENIIGATAPVPRLREVTKRYRATFGYGEADAGGDYAVSHSSAMYLFDAEGRARALFRPDDGVTAMAADLARVLDG
ncbi:SCO family protein [Spiribacter halobius]|uniref:Cytochrome c oxidase assembly protein n=1 Tax=Sediminicurvatus halobius TaxID=2182432 RepID=A0A2U2MYU3_9GAMM|nr:SCO family protein [Spiribacter halobius]PWG61963.1 cytochrome c oxidase assembly protein [Spiribacter halobius]UEX78370.1 SCO family protein [Spiribacter halobius]